MYKKIIILCLLLLACSSQSAFAQKLRIAICPSWAPLEFYNTEHKICGFSADYARALAREMGMDFEILDISRSVVFEKLLNRDVDLIISSMAITKERAHMVAFSKSYLTTYQTLVVRFDAPKITLGNLQGKRIGVKAATTSYNIAKSRHATCMAYVDITKAFSDLWAGKLNGILCDSPVASYFVNKMPSAKDKFKISDYVTPPEFYAVALRHNELALLDKVNRAIVALERNGTFDKLVNKWIGRR